jgi:hypothetical protein
MSNGAAAAEASVIPPPIDTVLLPMKVTEFPVGAGPCLCGTGETAAVADAALVGVLALADGVGEAAVVADAAAAAVPACDGGPQPATTASRVADTALANVKRHRRRGCGAGIAELSFDRVTRSDDPLVVRQPGKAADRVRSSRRSTSRCRRGRKGCRPARPLFDRRNTGQIRAWW